MLNREQVLGMANNDDLQAKGYHPVETAAKFEACSMCYKKRDAAVDTPLLKCPGCKKASYCSTECHALHFEEHTAICRGNKNHEQWVNDVTKSCLETLFPDEDGDDRVRKFQAMQGSGLRK